MANSKNWSQQTKMVHEAMPRSPYGETGEALYLTSGFSYESAEQAELAESDAASFSLRDADDLLSELIRHLDATPKSMLHGRLLHLSS